MNKAIGLILIFFTSFFVNAQLTTNSNVSPNFLVQNILLGGGVTATNINYTGDVDAIGSFNGSNCNIGLSSGVIMTTGTVENSTDFFGEQQGPFGPNNNGGAGIDNGYGGDALLNGLSSASTQNAAILEFDFEAVGPDVSFRYVFASEEYLEYVNAGFNDVFGFFISGPNPSGGNYTNKNIALIPGTLTPVTIDNLNSTSFSQYYNNNGDGSSGSQYSNNSVVQYDGFTDVLTAEADVVCGQTYHIKIAIADAGDGAWDSGVFLEAQSFTSIAPLSMASQIITQGNLGPNQILEGCGSADIIFTRIDSINFNQTFSLSYSGTASNGVDYSNLPNSVSFSAGQTVQSINVQSIYDLLAEGSESLSITMTYSGTCGQNQTETIILTIVDQTPLSLSLLDQVVINCPNGNPLNLIATPVGGTPNYIFDWSTGESSSFISVNPPSTTTYYVTVSDECGYQSVYDSIEVLIPIYSPIDITVNNDTSIMCPNTPIDLYSNVVGGAGGYTWEWSNGSNQQNTSVETLESEQYFLTVTDMCDAEMSDSVYITIVIPVISTETYGRTTICSGDSTLVGVIASGGSGEYFYNWNTFETVSEISVSPSLSTTYFVSVIDSCVSLGYYEVIDSVTVYINKPTAAFTTEADNFVVETPINFINQSVDAVSYYWEFGNDETSMEVNPATTYFEDGEITVMLVAENLAGCLDTAYHTLYVNPEMVFYVPNTFTPNGDGNNDYFYGNGVGVMESQMKIFDRWGQLIYNSSGLRNTWDGRIKGIPAPDGIYVWQVELLGFDGTEYKKTGHVSLLR